MWTVTLVPFPRVPNAHVRTPAEIEQLPAPVPPSIAHDVPASVGRVSDTETFLADPVPEFVMVMVNPMLSPAETGDASAVLVMWIEAHRTCVDADAWTDVLFVAL